MLDDILFTICTRTGWALQQLANGGHRVTVPVGGGQRPVVTIAYVDDEATGLRWARYLAKIGNAADFDHTMCLRVNAQMSTTTGSIGIVGNDLVFLDTQLVQDADQTEVEQSIRYVAKGAAQFDELAARYGSEC